MSDRTASERLNPRATRARTGGQPHRSVQQANARGRVVVAGSAPPSNPTEERRQRYIEEARRARAEMGFFGHVDAAVRGAANTLTFGGADALAAGGDALFGSGEGTTIGDRYRDNRMRQEAVTQADSEVHGPAGEAGEFVAGFVPYERGARVAVAGYRAVRGGGERILRSVRGRRGGRACRTCSRRPVALADGVKVTQDVDFELPGLPLLQLSRVYAGDLDFSGPLGRNRIGAFDEAIALREDGTVHYLMGSGLEADFAIPSADPGAVSRNVLHPDIALSRAPGETFEIRARGVVSRFSAYAPGVWLLIGWSDANGHGVTLHRDQSGLLERAERSDGFAFVFENDADGLRLSATLVAPNGESRPVSRYAYDSRGNLVGVANAYARSFYYGYDDEDRFAFYDDGVHTRVDYEYDEAGRVSRVRTPGGRSDHDIAYRPDLRETTVTYHTPQGPASTIYRFDDGGRTIEEIDPLGHVTRFERDEAGNILAETDPEGNRTSYGVDTFGFLAFAQDAEGRRTSYRHDADGRLEGRVEGDGAAWQWGYDERGNILFERDPLGHRADFHTDANGLPVGIMRHDGLIERRSYDAQHRLVRVVDFGGNITRFQRDAFGRVVARADAMGHVTRFEYEERTGADFWTPSAQIRPDGAVLRRSDQPGAIVVTDGEGASVTYRYGAFDLISDIVDAKGGQTTYAYDHLERLVRVTDPTGSEWTFEHDAAGRLSREIDFSGQVVEYENDRAGRPLAVRYVDRSSVRIAYDRSRRPVEVDSIEPDGTISDRVRYAYDDRGNVSSAVNRSARVAFERDALGRVVRETSNGRVVESTYTCCGDRDTLRFGTSRISAVFDPIGALQSLRIGSSAPLRFRNDAEGRETARGNDRGFALEQEWDAIGRLTGQRDRGSIERLLSWDRADRPTRIEERRWGTTRYRMDRNGQVSDAGFGDGGLLRFDYDAAHDLQAQVSQLSGGPFQKAAGRRIDAAFGPSGERIVLVHDIRGRVVGRRVEQNGYRPRLWRYVWDARSRMVGCLAPGGERWSYEYDALGRRTSKRRVLVEGDGGREPSAEQAGRTTAVVGTLYLWDGDVVVEEAPLRTDGTGDDGRAVRWHYEPQTYVPLVREEANGTVCYVVTDHLGTPRELVHEDGQTVWALEQNLWGGVRRLFVPANDNPDEAFGTEGSRLRVAAGAQEAQARAFCPIRFQGQWDDVEAGLFYNRFRSYDPLTAHYVSPDPLGLWGGINAYGYVEGPTVAVDVLGLKGVTVRPAPRGAAYDHVLEIQRSVYPETAGHIEDAIRSGQPDIMTPDRIKKNVSQRRRQSLKNVPCCAGKDRDEWPMAMSREGGTGASVRSIDPSDNRGAGKSIGHALSSAGVRDGQRVKVRVVP